MQVPSHPNLGSKIKVSPPFMFHFHPCCVSPPSRSLVLVLTPSMPPLTSIQVTRFAFHLHAGHVSHVFRSSISALSRPHPTPVHVYRYAANLQPGPISPLSRSLDSPPPRSCLTSLQGPIFGTQNITSTHVLSSMSCFTSIQVPLFAVNLYPGPMSSLSRYLDSCCTPIQVPISPPSRSHLKQIQVSRCAFHLLQSPDIHISPPYRSQHMHLTSFHVPIFASHLHPSWISPPSRSLNPYLTSIQVPSHLDPGLEMGITSIQIPIFTSHLHVGLKICVSPHLGRVLPVGGHWGLLKW